MLQAVEQDEFLDRMIVFKSLIYSASREVLCGLLEDSSGKSFKDLRPRLILEMESRLNALMDDEGSETRDTDLSDYQRVLELNQILQGGLLGMTYDLASAKLKVKAEDKGTDPILKTSTSKDKDEMVLTTAVTKAKHSEIPTMWRKDFKMTRSITEGGLSFTGLMRQIELGLAKGYTETEIVEGVIKGLHLETNCEAIWRD